MPLTARFDTPSSLRDAPDGSPFYESWHGHIASKLEAAEGPEGVGEFYDRTEVEVDTIARRGLVWMGMPRRRLVFEHQDNPREAYRMCDERFPKDLQLNRQEEYLEWHTERRDGKIVRVTFVTETPEYWEMLYRAHPEVVLAYYQEHVDPQVTKENLEDGGAYNPLNQWNTEKGIVHFINQDLGNTLPIAIGLAVGAVGISAGSRHFLDNFELSLAGILNAPTSADPRVQVDINTLARRRMSISLDEPVGVYMAGWDDTGWQKPDGTPVGNYWNIVRGKLGAALRVVYEVPSNEKFVVGDIRIGGRPIEFGSQLAEHVTVLIPGIAGRRVQSPLV